MAEAVYPCPLSRGFEEDLICIKNLFFNEL